MSMKVKRPAGLSVIGPSTAQLAVGKARFVVDSTVKLAPGTFVKANCKPLPFRSTFVICGDTTAGGAVTGGVSFFVHSCTKKFATQGMICEFALVGVWP